MKLWTLLKQRSGNSFYVAVGVFDEKKYCQQHWKEAACNFMLLQIVSCLAHTKSFNWGSDTPQESEPVMANTAHCSEILFFILSSFSQLPYNNFLVPN